MWWTARTPRPEEMRAYRPHGEPTRAERRLEAEKAAAEFEARKAAAAIANSSDGNFTQPLPVALPGVELADSFPP